MELPAGERRALEEWVLEGERAVIAAPDDEQVEPLRAVTERRRLTGSRLDLTGLTAFHDRWFRSLRG